MGFADKFRKRFGGRKSSALKGLETFAAERKGVEGFIEPRTATNPVTLLLVDRVGDHVRAAVRDEREAARFCDRFRIPVYDAALVGYPKRMRDFEMGRRSDSDYLDEQFRDLERRFQDSDSNTPDE